MRLHSRQQAGSPLSLLPLGGPFGRHVRWSDLQTAAAAEWILRHSAPASKVPAAAGRWDDGKRRVSALSALYCHATLAEFSAQPRPRFTGARRAGAYRRPGLWPTTSLSVPATYSLETCDCSVFV